MSLKAKYVLIILWLLAALMVASVCIKPSHGQGQGTTSPYTDPAQLCRVPFGRHSHWAQPWRAYLETVPVTVFLNGVGVNVGSYSEARIAQLAAAGVKDARVEEGWGHVSWDETSLDNAASFAAELVLLHKYHIRPLILLNWHQGDPCPMQWFSVTLTAPAKKGDTRITVADTSAIVPGLSGLSNLSGYWAAEDMFEAVNGHTITLSKPLPKDLPAGVYTCNLLKYHPFGLAGSPDYNATVAGACKYEDLVNASCVTVLGRGGYDLEIYNELQFGQHFNFRSDYEPAQRPTDYNRIVANLAAHVRNNGAYAGTRTGDGYANQIPWPGSSWVTTDAIDKHPYASREVFTLGAPDTNGVDALYNWGNTWTPGYTQHFPEYYGNVIQTETLLRDAGPFTDLSFLYAGKHGRYAAMTHPVPVWITEYRLDPDAGADADEVTKSALRAYCFYLNKGVTRLDWYNSDGLSDATLAGLGRLTAAMSAGLDAKAPARQIGLLSVSDTHGHYQFKGDGTPAHPTLYDRDVFAFLPYQVNAHRFVVPYYVMTRDVAKDLPAEQFTLALTGLGAGVKVSALDPATGQAVPVTTRQNGTSLSIDVQATDAVRLLILDDASH